MRLLTVALAALPALAYAQNLDIAVTKPVECTRKTQNGDTVSMKYKGTLTDGTQFDSNFDSGRPFEFKLGAHQVIDGWDKGLLDMCIGEGRMLTIPPGLAYGSQRVGPIPAGSTLIFETELLGIKGVEANPVDEPHHGNEPVLPGKPTPTHLDEAPKTDSLDEPMPTPPPEVSQSAAFAVPTAAPSSVAAAGKHPLDGEDGKGECNLLGDFALLVQGALGLLAVSSLAIKRLREHPRRPMKIWFFDVSKQVFGSVLLHLANVLMSMLSSGQFDIATQTQNAGAAAVAAEKGDDPNPCSFYLLNLAIDVCCNTLSCLTLQVLTPNRLRSVFRSSFCSSKSSTAPSSSHPSHPHRNPSAAATTATHLAPPGGLSSP